MDSNFNQQENPQYTTTEQPYQQQAYQQEPPYGQYTQQQPYVDPVSGQPYGVPQPTPPGQGKAIASMVCGIIGTFVLCFVYFGIVSIGLGIAGLILAASAKKDGYKGGIRTAGFILSLIGLILGALELVACIGCIVFILGEGSSDFHDFNFPNSYRY